MPDPLELLYETVFTCTIASLKGSVGFPGGGGGGPSTVELSAVCLCG